MLPGHKKAALRVRNAAPVATLQRDGQSAAGGGLFPSALNTDVNHVGIAAFHHM
jgi:hypothetical protein